MNKILLTAILGLFLSSITYAEKIIEGREANAIFQGAEYVRYKDNISNPVFIRFSDGKGPQLENALKWISLNFNLKEEFTLSVDKTEEDNLGFTHLKVAQYFNGKLVEFANIRVHAKGDRVVSINGFSASDIPTTNYIMDEATSLKHALDFINADKYKWEFPEEEDFIKRKSGDQEATFYPKGEQVYLSENLNFSSSNIIPCWKFDVYAQIPLYRAYVYVNATDGSVLFEDMRIKDVDTNGTAQTTYSGSRAIVTDLQTNSFRLREGSRGSGVETYDMLNGTSYGSAVDFTNTTNIWPDTLRYKYATDAHWGAEMVYDYYLNEHGRNSFDGMGAKMESYVHYSTNYANAFWDGSVMTYGDGNGGSITAMTTLDINGHEVTHGVDQYSSNLVYSRESGALDESFADIFGNAIEAFYKPHPVNNWLVGEEIGNNFRSMSNPKAKSDPDTYMGVNWHTSPSDNYGVHTNSGVQNHWFYLLSVGGTGSNDNGDSYSVTGISITKAAKIAYRSRTTYLVSLSEYSDAREGAIQSAVDLYGPCSPELEATVDAWYAVGVGGPYSSTVVSDFEANETISCNLPATVYFTNLSNYNAVTYVWDFGDGNISNVKNPVHTYSAAGNYTVELTAIGNVNCGSDIEEKTNYIDVDPPAAVQADPYSICVGWPARITANAANTAFWYMDSVSTDPIFVGNPYVSPTLFDDTVYYVGNGVLTPSQNVGPSDNTIGAGANFSSYRYLVFDAFDKFTLESVKVYSFSNTSRVIELRNSFGDTIRTKTVTVGTGEQIIDLDFVVEPGTDYQLGVSVSTTADFFRNSSGAIYPYTINNMVSITSPGNAPPQYYYFFYDWKVKGKDCVGKRVGVDVTIDYDPNCIPYVGVDEKSALEELSIYPNPSKGMFNINFELVDKNELSFRLLDSKGVTVHLDRNIVFEKGMNTYVFENPNISSGIYLIQIEGDSMNESRRIIIQ